VGFDLGFLYAGQTITNRTATIKPVGIKAYPSNAVTDDTWMRGFTAGLGVGVKFGDRFPIGIRVGVGGFFGSFTDVRTGNFKTTGLSEATQVIPPGFTSTDYTINAAQSFTLTAFYVMPEIRAGVRVRKNLDVMLSLGGTLLISPNSPKWVPEDAIVEAGSDGSAEFTKETLADRVQFVGTPALLVNYRF
jgi:hypothetical protein